MINPIIPGEVADWFIENRGHYTWGGQDRGAAEERIEHIRIETSTALDNNNAEKLHESLLRIYKWKNPRYDKGLTWYPRHLRRKEGSDFTYSNKLLEMGPFNKRDNLKEVINHLDIPECRLPTSTAIASYRFGLKSA